MVWSENNTVLSSWSPWSQEGKRSVNKRAIKAKICGPGQREQDLGKHQVADLMCRGGQAGTDDLWGPEVARRILCYYSKNPGSYLNAFCV